MEVVDIMTANVGINTCCGVYEYKLRRYIQWSLFWNKIIQGAFGYYFQ